jgi:hypothetical protein
MPQLDSDFDVTGDASMTITTADDIAPQISMPPRQSAPVTPNRSVYRRLPPNIAARLATAGSDDMRYKAKRGIIETGNMYIV